MPNKLLNLFSRIISIYLNRKKNDQENQECNGDNWKFTQISSESQWKQDYNLLQFTVFDEYLAIGK